VGQGQAEGVRAVTVREWAPRVRSMVGWQDRPPTPPGGILKAALQFPLVERRFLIDHGFVPVVLAPLAVRHNEASCGHSVFVSAPSVMLCGPQGPSVQRTSVVLVVMMRTTTAQAVVLPRLGGSARRRLPWWQ
jgi:hypothetical protein